MNKPLILIDTSYTSFYRFFATIRWFSFAFPEEFKELKSDNKYDWSKNEIFINDFEFCPHHQDGNIKKYTTKCHCRKPNNLMVLKIQKRWTIDIKKSFFIGNNLSDKICAEKSNLKYFNYSRNLFNKIRF